MEIDPDYIQFVHLHDPIEFEKEWLFEWQENGLTQEDAYDLVEERYQKCWGEHKYKNFRSFYSGWHRRVTKRLERKKRMEE